jgi:alkylation response protein AidB-like acyl-CoA dehydrogenase
LVPMRQPGVEVRPIAQPDGTAGFNEVIFRGARTPIDHVVGGVDNGWTVAMSTLGFERETSATSSWQRFARDLNDVISVARATGRIDDAVVRQRVSRAYTMVQIQRINGYRVVTSVLHPEVASSTAALEAGTKAVYTEFLQELTNLAMDVAGLSGMVLSGRDAPVPGVGMGDRPVLHEYPANAVQSAFLFARAGTIYGGTSQIQRNILGERVLGLPREPAVK